MQIITYKLKSGHYKFINFKNVAILLAIIIFIAEFIVISTHKSIWRDEAFSILLSHSDIFAIFQKTAHDVNPPLFYILIKPFVKIFGHQDSLIRTINLIFIIPGLIFLKKIIYLINQKIKINKNILLIAALSLFISNNVFLHQAVEVRTYSLLTFEISLSIYLIYKTFFAQKTMPGIWLSLNLIAIAYSHNTGIFWIISVFISLSLEFLINKRYQLFYKLLKIYLLLFLVYIPWLLVQLQQIHRASQNFWLSFDAKKSLDQFIGVFIGIERFQELATKSRYLRLYQVASFLTYLGIIRLSFLKKWRWLSLSFLLSLNFVYFYSYFFTPILYSRYLGFIASSAFILNLFGIFFLWQLKPKYIFKTISIAIFILVFYLQISLIPDLLNKLNRTDYLYLKQTDQSIAIFTPEELDYMSCRYYRDDCKFLKMEKLTQYTGVNLLTQFQVVDNFQTLELNNIYILYKDYHQNDILEFTKNLNYQEISKVYLGDHSILSEYKKTKPSQ